VNLRNDPQLSGQANPLPPKTLDVDGDLRTLNREVSVEQALRLARSGLRAFVMSPALSSEVSSDQLQSILAAYASGFQGMGTGHPPEAFVHVYGRRSDARGRDTRVVVASILEFESLKGA
jgi:hypothetical protein